MSESNEVDLTAIRDTVFGELKMKWGWLLALGIFMFFIHFALITDAISSVNTP